MAKTNKSTGCTDRELLEKIKNSHEKPKIWTTAHPPHRSRIQFDPHMLKQLSADPNRLINKKGKRRPQKHQLRAQKVLPRR